MKVKDLELMASGNDVFLCSKIELKEAKTGKKYYDVELRDDTGSIVAKVWNVTAVEDGVVVGSLVDTTYTVTEFNGALQLNVTAMAVHRGSSKVEDFFPHTKFDVEKMWGTLQELLNSIQDEEYRKVAAYFSENEEWVKKFKNHSAAVRVHHAFVGGLLQHTLFVMRVCNSFAKIYGLNRDLLLTAAFLHDNGKLYEISTFPENEYTTTGNLFGHVSEGAYWVRRVCEELEISREKTENLFHCILAHHGSLEFGAPVVPSLEEAWALHLADLADSRFQIAREDLESVGSGRNRYLGTKMMMTARGEYEV